MLGAALRQLLGQIHSLQPLGQFPRRAGVSPKDEGQKGAKLS